MKSQTVQWRALTRTSTVKYVAHVKPRATDLLPGHVLFWALIPIIMLVAIKKATFFSSFDDTQSRDLHGSVSMAATGESLLGSSQEMPLVLSFT